jgi:hypothetical protein
MPRHARHKTSGLIWHTAPCINERIAAPLKRMNACTGLLQHVQQTSRLVRHAPQTLIRAMGPSCVAPWIGLANTLSGDSAHRRAYSSRNDWFAT